MTSILGPIASGGSALPRYLFRVPAGFPSPAADHMEQPISLDELFNLRAPHMYLVRIDGDSMQGAGIFDGEPAGPAHTGLHIGAHMSARIWLLALA
ncbi:MAG: LexA family protein, partial [Gammaproteobacteria bacterium]